MNEIEKLKEKQEKLERDIEALGTQINELEEKEITKSGKRWRGVKDRFYWYIEGDCEVYGEYEKDDDYDNARYEIGNYFRTEEEAKKVVEKIKIYTRLKDLALRLNKGEKIDWDNSTSAKWSIGLSNSNNALQCCYAYKGQDVGQIYCLDPDFLNIAKQEIGEENLRKLFE